MQAYRLVGFVLVLGTISATHAGAPPHDSLGRPAERCRAAVDAGVQDYMAARRFALLQCHSDTNEGRLAPRDCVTEPATAAAITAAELEVTDRLHADCNDQTVTAAPPRGIGARICGEDAACGFSFERLDDGTRGDRNDYVDCLLCLAEDAVDGQIEAAYEGVISPNPAPAELQCRTRLAQATLAYDHRRRTLERQGRPDTQDRLAAAQQKIATRLLSDCRETTATATASPTPKTSPPPSATAPARTARTP